MLSSVCIPLRHHFLQEFRPEVNEKTSTVSFGDPNIFIQINNLQKAGLLGQWKWDSRKFPKLEKGIDNGAYNSSHYNLSIHALGKGVGCWSVL